MPATSAAVRRRQREPLPVAAARGPRSRPSARLGLSPAVEHAGQRLVRDTVSREDLGGDSGPGGQGEEEVFVADVAVLVADGDAQRPYEHVLRAPAERAAPRPPGPPPRP